MPDSIRKRVDLHMHSTASDGELSPAGLVQLALERGLAAIALTDHDTVAGLDEAIAAARDTPLQVVAGVELSCDVAQGEVHVLGYWINWHDRHFQSMLEKFRDGRIGRAEKMVRKLAALGAPVSFERVREIAGDASIGRPHVAQALVEAGHVANSSEAFDRYIGRHGPAYVERFKLTPQDAVALILQVRGVPVLAHPREVIEYVFPLVKVGLLGLEVSYAGYDDLTRSELSRLAKQYGLIQTGGSDFHGRSRVQGMDALGQVDLSYEVVDKLRAKAATIE